MYSGKINATLLIWLTRRCTNVWDPPMR
eukprot:COSAG05_NODE_12351_length_471_cov_1.206989_1_plen_27_part_10